MNQTHFKNPYYPLIVLFKPEPELNRNWPLKIKFAKPEPELNR